MLVIEGTDLVGKTTLCKTFLERPELSNRGYIYAHFSRLPHNFCRYNGYRQRMSRCIVQDRFHMSEIAYASVNGISTPLTTEWYRIIDAHLRLLGGVTVLITAADDLIRSRVREGELFPIEKILEANKNFINIAESHMGTDIDFWFHMTKLRPFVDDSMINSVMAKYMKRQAIIDEITTYGSHYFKTVCDGLVRDRAATS